ncbi:MipA/OmpV family protein [Massilia sp. GCM10023247]|uniref:MipA/OmpV family protein n=1 Tax=Massilia sp. GCM10023247 TaxID=3252643 RepID=UPI003613DBA9
MTKLFVLAALVSGAAASGAAAQTPASNPMPDGSRDMYIGLGVASKPRYEGSADREASALPVIQFQWSNGVFVSGMSAGMHLSRVPQVEFGPLLEVQPGRDASGAGNTAGGIEATSFAIRAVPDNLPPFMPAGFPENRLAGMTEIDARLQAGAFLNLYLTPSWRLTGSALYGAGNARHGGRLDLGLQRLAMHIGAQHRVTLGAGLTLVNRSHNRAFFGVTEEESINSGNLMYAPDGGLRDVHLGARWNWALSPSWMLTSQVQASRLQGDARRSPLVERPTNLTVSTAIAWRF